LAHQSRRIHIIKDLSVISFQPKFGLLKLYKKDFKLRIDLRPQMLYTKDRIQEFAEAPVHESKKI